MAEQAAVVLVGPRQVGKTTLAHSLAHSLAQAQDDAQPAPRYLDLENPADVAKLADVPAYVAGHEGHLVVIDEVHRAPGLFPALRGVIDDGRRRGLRTGRFLLLGSAALELLRQSGETLAGRVAYVEMTPLQVLEVPADSATMDRLWIRGGFPDSFTASTDAASLRWRRDFIRTYLERDVAQFGPRIPAELLGRLWTMLAHGQGTLLNASRLAGALGISAQTVVRYLDLLVDLLLVRRLTPYHGNGTKRLVKAPKTYVRDSGLVHALLDLPSREEVLGHPVAGASWEGWVLENLLAAAPARTQASFYRTAAGAELDLVLELPGGERWAVEIKRGQAPVLARGFHEALQDLAPARAFVVYGGEETYVGAAGVTFLPVRALAEALAARA